MHFSSAESKGEGLFLRQVTFVVPHHVIEEKQIVFNGTYHMYVEYLCHTCYVYLLASKNIHSYVCAVRELEDPIVHTYTITCQNMGLKGFKFKLGLCPPSF